MWTTCTLCDIMMFQMNARHPVHPSIDSLPPSDDPVLIASTSSSTLFIECIDFQRICEQHGEYHVYLEGLIGGYGNANRIRYFEKFQAMAVELVSRVEAGTVQMYLNDR